MAHRWRQPIDEEERRALFNGVRDLRQILKIFFVERLPDPIG